MRDSWLGLVAGVLRPRRPHLARCVRARELHRAARGPVLESRARAIANCEARIERARAAVLEANDGVVSAEMRELEREWHTLSRPDPDGELMELWARIAPASWIDRKRWRDSEPVARVNAAIALAADVEGVEAAEAAVESLRTALAGWGVAIGSRVRWHAFDGDRACVGGLLAEPLRVVRAILSAHEAEPVIAARARALEQAVHAAALSRLPHRPHLAADLARAAEVDTFMRAAAPPDRPNPVTALRALWNAGYPLTGAGRTGVTLEIPPL